MKMEYMFTLSSSVNAAVVFGAFLSKYMWTDELLGAL